MNLGTLSYVELALIELRERDVFPHVARRTWADAPSSNCEVLSIPYTSVSLALLVELKSFTASWVS